jgi:hypothetical protein
MDFQLPKYVIEIPKGARAPTPKTHEKTNKPSTLVCRSPSPSPIKKTRKTTSRHTAGVQLWPARRQHEAASQPAGWSFWSGRQQSSREHKGRSRFARAAHTGSHRTVPGTPASRQASHLGVATCRRPGSPYGDAHAMQPPFFELF